MDHKEDGGNSRRKFIKQSALLGTGLMLPISTFAIGTNKNGNHNSGKNILSKGYAARDSSGKLSPWTFERRAVGDNDILIDIKFSSICHTDIHQLSGHWGPQPFPQVPGHEMAGIVASVGKNVTKFKIGDRAGVGCMVDSCMTCESCTHGEEQYCDKHEVLWTYGAADKTAPTGITQGGYANNIVVKEHFAIKIPDSIRLQDAAPLLCAGITSYSPLVDNKMQKGQKVGIAGIGGLGHLAIKLAKARGCEVYAFTTSPAKVQDILNFGAKEVIVVDNLGKLKPYEKMLDCMISTIPYDFNVGAYSSVVKPYGEFIQLGVARNGDYTLNAFAFNTNRVKFSAGLIGSIALTQQLVDYCAINKIYPQIQMINAPEINNAWVKILNKEARYRFVIDAATF
ncbi:molecular chaperone GroES [Chryseobacterium sp. Leaf405]|uniref:NAD(P)-dependent alcohol dehydrogenase n=1 Tax=Chryseobacterium sp. Leaf405 TaxID=1736367 RepID=UPI0006F226E0|nr:NAD(P)-dependent alcohol dehydrogenase [Chryseobacterium sp. Leaf405]KQT35641.1 molecular chaperone GroES [Chryseobacterium sp. Leaf405]